MWQTIRCEGDMVCFFFTIVIRATHGWDRGGLPHLPGVPYQIYPCACGISIYVLGAHFTLPDLKMPGGFSYKVFYKPHLDCHHSGHSHISEPHLSKFSHCEQDK